MWIKRFSLKIPSHFNDQITPGLIHEISNLADELNNHFKLTISSIQERFNWFTVQNL